MPLGDAMTACRHQATREQDHVVLRCEALSEITRKVTPALRKGSYGKGRDTTAGLGARCKSCRQSFPQHLVAPAPKVPLGLAS
jgi:hypothetical protein